jgi:integrase
MSKRDYGTGGMRKRGKNWQTIYWMPPDPITGKRSRKSFTARTKKEVFALRDAFRQRVEHGLDVAGAESTLGEYFEQWLSEHASRSVSQRTLVVYQQTGRVFVATIADVRLENLRAQHIERALRIYLDTGASNRTASKHLTVLKQALKHAVRLQLIPNNPADAIAKPRPEHREMQIADADTRRLLLDGCADEDFRRLIYVAVHTGLRAGELLGLKWSDINWERSTLQVVRARNEFTESGFGEPKTAAGRRSVMLSEEAIQVLRGHRHAQREAWIAQGSSWTADALVFSRRDGTPENVRNNAKKWGALCRKVGIGGLRFHDLRHTSATIALEGGVHPKVVQERLGHSTISITLDTYSHVLPAMQEDAARRIGDAMGDLGPARGASA